MNVIDVTVVLRPSPCFVLFPENGVAFWRKLGKLMAVTMVGGIRIICLKE